jgi:hypothetical protein
VVEFDFDAVVIEWRGPAPYAYVPLPQWVADEVAGLAKAVTYGWGMIPVEAQVGDTVWTTSLFPKAGGYLLPVKVSVQRAESVGIGSPVTVTMKVLGL